MKQVALNGRETKAPKGCEIKETANSRKLSTNFTDRIIIKDPTTADV
jgi:hypothetical protein